MSLVLEYTNSLILESEIIEEYGINSVNYVKDVINDLEIDISNNEELIDILEVVLISERMDISPKVKKIINSAVSNTTNKRDELAQGAVRGLLTKGTKILFNIGLRNLKKKPTDTLDFLKTLQDISKNDPLSRRQLLKSTGGTIKKRIMKNLMKSGITKLTTGDKAVLTGIIGVGMTPKEKQLKLNRRQFLGGLLGAATTAPAFRKATVSTGKGILSAIDPYPTTRWLEN